ncbi:MAG: PQQ-dependent sugar dehydrogenase [Gammaproteobacteria bacterium]|nr:PQQ-dependent sugar dehydrogenase [Gammaproteobacteria bacterium]
MAIFETINGSTGDLSSMRHRIILALIGLLLTLPTTGQDYTLTTIAEKLDFPWCMAFLPNGDALVTERSGKLLRFGPGASSGEPIAGVPEVYARSQGGLFDVLIHPDFTANQLIYLSYAQGLPEANATRIARARLIDNRLEDLEVIFTVSPTKDTPVHYGGRMIFLTDGTLLITTGDGFDYREQAQNLNALLGKVVRITDDGGIPPDNPFAGLTGNEAAVFSYGHRNPQGLVLDTQTGRIFLHEHGPRGGDELNLIEAGGNYGWPMVTFGIDYNGAYVSPFSELPGITAPLTYWVPSIGPSGLAIYNGALFPDWHGDLFVGALVNQEVRRLDLDNGSVVAEEVLFAELGERIRDIRVDAKGYIYLLTDSSEGRIVRVSPTDQQAPATGG